MVKNSPGRTSNLRPRVHSATAHELFHSLFIARLGCTANLNPARQPRCRRRRRGSSWAASRGCPPPTPGSRWGTPTSPSRGRAPACRHPHRAPTPPPTPPPPQTSPPSSPPPRARPAGPVIVDKPARLHVSPRSADHRAGHADAHAPCQCHPRRSGGQHVDVRWPIRRPRSGRVSTR